MEVIRRGLSVRNVIESGNIKETLPISLKKNSVISNKSDKFKKPELTKTTFNIFQDPIISQCQHCGSNRENIFEKNKVKENNISTGVQVDSNVTDLNSWLCSENPPEDYWKVLAEERRVALEETLDENKELCSLVEKLNLEIERSKKITKHADYFANMYNLVKEQYSTAEDLAV